MLSDDEVLRHNFLNIDDEERNLQYSNSGSGLVDDEFENTKTIDILIKVVSGLVIFLSISIILLWVTYQSADLTFGGPPQSLTLWEDQYREMTGLDDVNGLDGSGTVVCIVDTGIDSNHPDLEHANVVSFLVLLGWLRCSPRVAAITSGCFEAFSISINSRIYLLLLLQYKQVYYLFRKVVSF